MSSMVRAATALLLLFMAVTSVPARCQDGSDWDRARAQLMVSQRGSIAQAVDRWKQLSATDRFSFTDYASFLLSYPGFPEEEKLRGYAERAAQREAVDPSRLIAYFDRFKPMSNPAKALYAIALSGARRADARTVAVGAWRGGNMSDSAEATLFSLWGSAFAPQDQDARMNALLWDGAVTLAQRQATRVTPAASPLFMARLAMLQGQEPGALGLPITGDALRDPGYVYNRVRQLRRAGNNGAAIRILATRPPAATPPLYPGSWITELLNSAKAADPNSAVRIAASVDDSFAPGTDISRMSFHLRDDYTSLMWLGGTKALQVLGDSARAAPLFYRYGAAARTPQTRSKGFYWAGRALAQNGDVSGANRYFEMAAAYPDQYYGMLAAERLGRPLPDFNRNVPTGAPTQAEREAFNAKPITAAVREVARDFDWPTTVRFFREICEQAESEGDHLLVAELARTLGRRDLAVILGQSAHADGFGNFQTISFPLIPNPPGTDFTMVHAITRQESQFAQNAVSHAGATGLMQLMPGTARAQAGQIGLAYNAGALISDPGYNIRLGDAFFGKMMDYYGGSYPLAVAAYNAGPGNVNRFLAQNGDPRRGGIDWVDWVERIPIQETRNYVQRVLENAVVYEAMNPARASYRGRNPLSHFLGKPNPG